LQIQIANIEQAHPLTIKHPIDSLLNPTDALILEATATKKHPINHDKSSYPQYNNALRVDLVSKIFNLFDGECLFIHDLIK
jgi:hypothetical protein